MRPTRLTPHLHCHIDWKAPSIQKFSVVLNGIWDCEAVHADKFKLQKDLTVSGHELETVVN